MDRIMIIVKSGPVNGTGVKEGLRLSTAMLGMDVLPVLVFVDEGVECLRSGAFSDSSMWDYLKAVADLAGVHVLSESMEVRGLRVSDLDTELAAAPVDLAWLAKMMMECEVAAAF